MRILRDAFLLSLIHIYIHAKLHHRRIDRHNALGTGKVLADVPRGGGEFLFLIFLTHIALDHAYGLYVFLNRIVQRVVFAEHSAENRHCLADDQHLSLIHILTLAPNWPTKAGATAAYTLSPD